MDVVAAQAYTAFAGVQRLATRPIRDVARAVKIRADAYPKLRVLVFDNTTAQSVEFGLRGTVEDVLAHLDRAASSATQSAELKSRLRGPGRPRFGVIAHKVTLLPRHWDWSAVQPGEASVTLCKLVEDTRRAVEGANRRREAQEAVYRFMSAMASNVARLEGTTRALFVADVTAFESFTQSWPTDMRDFVRELASRASRPQQEAV